MNSKQLQYAIELSETRSFSKVSEKFNISQPALSKQIQSLEKELEIKLFDRNTVPFTLTSAGEYFIREAQALLYREDQMLRSLEQFKSGEKGRLTIGVSPFRNLSMLPNAIRKFRVRYPQVQIILHETNSDQLRKEAADGKYDFAIVNLPVDDSVLETTLLEQESLVLAVPNSMLSKIEGKPDLKTRKIDFARCRALPFVVVAQTQEMRRYFDSLCARCGLTPEIVVEVAGGVTSAWSMARAGLGATLLPLQFAAEDQFVENLTLFTLNDVEFTRQPVIVTRRNQYVSPYAQHMIELLKKVQDE